MTVSIPEWSSRYPDPKVLRAEVSKAADTFIESLNRLVPEPDIAGIYVKGSGLKQWNSPLDYVPVLSDVDIHLLFASEDALLRFDTLDVALALSGMSEKAFLAAVPQALHMPRIQLILANRLFGQPDFVPSPEETVEDRIGVPYPRHHIDPIRTRRIAIERTLEHRTYLSELPHALADLTGRHLRRILHTLSWRVSPTAPRVLELLGVDFRRCWTSNRTALVGILDENGETATAEAYRDYYLSAWDYFLSNDEDGDAARQAIRLGTEILYRAIEIAEAAELRDDPVQVSTG